MNVFGEIGSTYPLPIVVANQSPVSLPTLTADFDPSPMFYKISIGLSTPYDFSTVQFTSCLMKSNAFWKSTTQLQTSLFLSVLDCWQSVSTSGFVELYTSIFSKSCLFVRHVLLRSCLQAIQKDYHKYFSHVIY